MMSVRANIDAAIEHLRECDGDIPDLIDQCSRLNELADEVDVLCSTPVDNLPDRVERIATRIRQEVESIQREMGQS